MRVPGARRSSQATATVSPAAAIPCRPSRAEVAAPFRRAGADQVRPSSVERQAHRSPSSRPSARIAVTTTARPVRATRGPRWRPRARRPWLGTRTGAENVRPPSRDPAKKIARSSPKTRPTLAPAAASCGCTPGNSAAGGADARRARVRAASMGGSFGQRAIIVSIGFARNGYFHRVICERQLENKADGDANLFPGNDPCRKYSVQRMSVADSRAVCRADTSLELAAETRATYTALGIEGGVVRLEARLDGIALIRLRPERRDPERGPPVPTTSSISDARAASGPLGFP